LTDPQRIELFARIASIYQIAWGGTSRPSQSQLEELARQPQFKTTRRWVRATVQILELLNHSVVTIDSDLPRSLMETLLAILDRTLYPAMIGIPPGASRLARLNRWRIALASCNGNPEAVYAALAQCDSSIATGNDGSKVRAAIDSWGAGKTLSQ
jgi:hypothetical protein